MPNKKYCCKTAKQQLTNVCKTHGIVCPDNVLREYKPGVFGIPHPDMNSYYAISYCPWCGTKLVEPEEKEEDPCDNCNKLGSEYCATACDLDKQ